MARKTNRLVAFWERLPKEVRVIIYLAISGALAEVVKYLQIVDLNSATLIPVINVILVLVKNRRQIITSRI